MHEIPEAMAPTGSAAGRVVRGARAERQRRGARPGTERRCWARLQTPPSAEGHLSCHSTAQAVLAGTPATTNFVTSGHHLSRKKAGTGSQE